MKYASFVLGPSLCWWFIVINLQCFYSQNLGIFDICTPENDVCSKLDSCPLVKEAIKKGYRPKVCSFIGKEPIICCVKDINNKIGQEASTISSKMCDKYWDNICPEGTHYIQGGDPALEKELPFMALIGYGRVKNIEWKCGGTLISPRYVLSAAHCVLPKDPPRWVLLGVLDYATILDDAKPKRFSIEKIHKHPGYKVQWLYNDIALFRLNKDVKFNDFIRPICLNQSPNSILPKTEVVTAGWGRTENVGPLSKKLLKVNVNLFDINGCDRKEYLIDLPNGIDKNTMLCAGSAEGGKDSCAGDSGGPLFLQPRDTLNERLCFLHTQVGIVSFGYDCGLKEFPAIYTNIKFFIPWIESIVWPLNVTDPSLVWHD